MKEEKKEKKREEEDRVAKERDSMWSMWQVCGVGEPNGSPTHLPTALHHPVSLTNVTDSLKRRHVAHHARSLTLYYAVKVISVGCIY